MLVSPREMAIMIKVGVVAGCCAHHVVGVAPKAKENGEQTIDLAHDHNKYCYVLLPGRAVRHMYGGSIGAPPPPLLRVDCQGLVCNPNNQLAPVQPCSPMQACR